MQRRILAAVFVGAVALRLAYALLVHPDGLVWPDEVLYDRIAWQLARGGAYESYPYDATPGWPATLALVYAVAGHSFTAARVVQALLGGVLAVAVAGTGTLFFGRTTGLLAGAGVALYPPLIYLPAVLYADHHGAVLLASTLWALAWWRTRRDARPLLLAGVLLGLTALTRPAYLLLAPVAALYVLVEGVPGRRLRHAILVGAVAAAVVAPWTVRNALVFDHFVPVSTGFGLHLWRGNNEVSRGDADDRHLLPLNDLWHARVAALPPAAAATVRAEGERLGAELARRDPVAQDALLRDVALRRIAGDPLRFARLSLHRVVTLHSPFSRTVTANEAGSARNRLIATIALLPVLGLGLIGIGLALRRVLASWIVPAFILAPTLLYTALTAATRFRLPLDPLWILLAAVPVALLWERVAPRAARGSGRARTSEVTAS